MSRLRIGFVILGLVVVLGAANVVIAQKQRVLERGGLIYLPLGPRDPRSLIQGDYMTLRYDRNVFPPASVLVTAPDRGTVVLSLDQEGRRRFARLDDGTPLASGEVRLRYKLRGRAREVHYGAESYFFQEGTARRYSGARFGVLRVDGKGNSVLVGLADAKRAIIAP
jgi:uncharacterized membrane-anchored protein